MCGIVGFITKEQHRGANDRRKFFEQALLVDMVRGGDSTGFFSVLHKQPENATADWAKIAADPLTFMRTNVYKEKLDKYAAFTDNRCIVGHNRSATVGSVDNDNAHPFQEGPITLVHNGTLTSTWGMTKSMQDLKDKGVEVDSHVIAHNLAEHDDPAEVIEKLDGAFTLIWHDARDNAIRIIRNDKRPLHMTWAKCEDTVLFASEGEMLFWLATRNNFTPGPIVYPKPYELLTFRPGTIQPEVREVPKYKPRSYRGYTGGATTTTRPTDPVPAWTTSAVKSIRLPPLMLKSLEDFELSPHDLLMYTPTKVTQVGKGGNAVVSGLVQHPEGDLLPCVLHGLLFNAVKDAAKDNETWAVRPIGVSNLEDGNLIVLAKLWSRKYNHFEIKNHYESLNRNPPGKAPAEPRRGLPRIGSRNPNEYVPGPHDEWIPVTTWLSITADGCVQCGTPIDADDAESVVWVQGGSRPLCFECDADNRVNMGHMH